MTGYTRQSTFIPGDVIKAEHGNDEFNQLAAFASQATGHKHDGTAAEGAYIPLISNTFNTDKVEVVAGGAKTTGTHQVTGLLTADAGINVTAGTFTSVGIDDNATGERLQVTDGELTLGTSGTGFSLIRSVADSIFTIAGGNTFNDGSNIRLHGSTHATQANDFQIRAGNNLELNYDDSDSSWNFQANAIATSGPLSCGALTSNGIDDNATSERVQIADSILTLGTAGSAYTVCNAPDDQQLVISGGGSAALGANIIMNGSTKASAPGDFFFRDDAVDVLRYSSSGSSWDFQANDILTSGTVDGRDVSADGTKLDTIDTNAADDQTGAEIKAAYEVEVNAFTDAQFTKLAGIETGATADQSNAEIKVAYEANANTNEFSDAEQTKLLGIETGATADQTKGDIDALNIDADTVDGNHASAFQPVDADLTAIAALAKTNSNFIVGNGSTWVAEAGATARTSLGLGSLATLNTVNNGNWSGTDLAVVNGGTGSSTASGAFTNIKQAASETVTGVVERATQAEVDAGTDTTRYVSPATLAAAPTNTLADIAAASVGAVGTYAMMEASNTTRAPGATLAGSSLNFAGVNDITAQPGDNTWQSTTSGSGTWRLMGYNESSGSSGLSYSLWLRIS